jgi:hypothetical protein
VEALASFCHSRIDGFYRDLALRNGQTNAICFAEKSQPGFGAGYPASVPSLLSEVYPDLREVVLVRDFRDMICSWLAFGRKYGPQFAQRPLGMTDEDYIRFWGGVVGKLVRHWEARSESAYLLRYENLIREPHETIERLLSYAGVDSGPATVQALVTTLSKGEREFDRQATSKSAPASIGRWQRDLSDDLQELSNEVFGPALECFGYSMEAVAGK